VYSDTRISFSSLSLSSFSTWYLEPNERVILISAFPVGPLLIGANFFLETVSVFRFLFFLPVHCSPAVLFIVTVHAYCSPHYLRTVRYCSSAYCSPCCLLYCSCALFTVLSIFRQVFPVGCLDTVSCPSIPR